MAVPPSRMSASSASAGASRSEALPLEIVDETRAGTGQAQATAALVAGMLSVQTGASMAKLLFPVLGTLGTACMRVLLAAFVLLLIVRPWRQPSLRRPSWPIMRSIVAYGLTLGVMNTVFYAALARLPLGIAVAIEFVGPLTLAVLASRRALDLLWTALALGGLLLLTQPWATGGHRIDPLGVLLALAAGVTWGLYILAGRRLGTHVEGSAATALGMTVAALVVLPMGFGAIPQAAAHPRLLAAALGMAVLSSAVPYSIEMAALRRMTTRGFSILMSLEPVVAALTGLALLGEQLSSLRWLAIGGIALACLGSAAAGDAPDPLKAAP